MSITSDELNFLVYRYLHESGFRHAAYTFGCESLVAKSNINGAKIAPGELVNLVQKGIMYTELERSVADDGADIDAENFSLLRAASDGKAVKRSREGEGAPSASAASTIEAAPTPESAGSSSASGSVSGTAVASAGAPSTAKGSAASKLEETPEEDVTTLSGHTSEVFICAWSPTSLQLASGSGDSTARIWQVPDGPCGKAQAGQLPEPVVLQHFSGDKEKSKDVTTLDWNHDGTALATGSYDGQARVWSSTGKLTATLSKHKGPIFSLKWNRTGQYLLSGSVDKTAVIWDTASGTVKQEFAFHKEPTLDVDWRDDDSFASCSTDKMIYVCKLGQSSHLKCFKGHNDEVNAIKWDPSGQLLASCSDDFTAKVWSMKHDQCVQDLREHTREIYTIKWSPTGPGSNNPAANLVLASASFDATIRIWDPQTGKSIHVLDKHSDPVYSVAFSADGQYLASGSFDRCLHIWSVKDGSLIKTYRGNGGIFEVCWNADGSKVAACFSTHIVSVIDVRM
mmetsp:Transcript_38573/g.82191  ORF Transcript_38573/g.82191 Transcript_38573/m.82191 type:complete len:511 (-) Transcript_38573:228-1760(-)